MLSSGVRPERRQLTAFALCAAAGGLGMLPGAQGGVNPVAELAWLTLLAPAAGAACAALGVALLPYGIGVTLVWFAALTAADALSARDLASAHWAALAVAGLFAFGHALGRLARLHGGESLPLACKAAGAALLVALVLCGPSVGFGLGGGGSPIARSHPLVARAWFDLSPLTLVFDCAGFDWAHAQPDVYERAGVEWFQRKPYAGNLAGPAVLVVGLGASWLARTLGARQAGAGSRRR